MPIPTDLKNEDIEYVKLYGLRKADRLKLEDASRRLFDATARHEACRLFQRHGIKVPMHEEIEIDLSQSDTGTTSNEVYDAALNYASVKLYISTVCMSPMEVEEVLSKTATRL